MTVSIAEDVVPEGNVAASEDFTINARVTGTITFDDTSGESGGDTGVNINFGESVSGLQLAHLSASAGTLSNLTGSGTSWEADLDFPATGMGTVTVTLAEDSTTPQNAEAEASIDYDEPLALAWEVPTVPTDNTFPVTLTSNHELQGVVIADFRLRIHDNSEAVIILDATNATLTAVAGTNNWRLDISLTGTFDGDYTVRVRRNSLMFDGMNVPTPALASAAFAIDTSLGVDAVLDITLDATSVEQGEIVNATFTFDKAVGDFTAADVTVSAGTKGALTDNGDNTYSMPITAPATGSGDVDVDVAADVVTPGNNSDTASFAYTEPVVALSFGSEAIGNQAWVVGTEVTLTLPEATGGVGTITYSLSPTLPAGTTFTAGTRALAGNPTGRFSSETFTYTATDADSNTVELTFTIVVTAPAITFASTFANQAWVVGTAVSETLPTASGGVGSFTYSLSPTTPAGVTFTAGTQALAGNPTARFSSATFTYTAEDAEGFTQTQTFTIVVTAPAITFTPTTFANQSWTVGTAVALTLPAGSGGVGTLTPSLIGTLPAGVTFTAGTRALAGNPTAVFASATFTYTMTDAEGESEDITFTIVVAAAAVAIPSNLTGTGVQVGSAVQFGIGFGGPSALASDGTTVFMFHLRRGYTLNPATGIAVQVGGNNLGLSFNPRLSAAMYHNGEIIVHGTQNDELYSFDTTTYTLTAIGTGITIAGSNSSPVITGMTSLGGIIYVAEAFTDALMILDESTSVLTPVDADTVGYGLDSPNIQSLGAYKGMLVGVNIDSTVLAIRLVELSQTDGTATAFNNIVPPDNAITGMVEHDDELLGAGNQNDALYRFYDILWDATIDDLEVDEGDNATWSLSDISQDADTFSLPTSPPSWLSVSGTDLVATTAPDVNADQNNDVTVRATRDSIDVDEIIRIVVKDLGATPPALSFGSGTIANQTWGVDAAESLTLPEATGGTGTIIYSLSPTLPDGVTFTAATRVLAGTPTGRFTSATFTYTATDGNSDTVELTFTIVVTADAISFASTVANQSWVVGTAVNLTLPTASGGVGSFTYSLTPTLPSGVSFTAATRVVSGNPTATATVATYTYTATDSESVTRTLTFTVVVTASAITFASTIANQAWTVGTAVSLTLPTASGGAGTFTYSLSPTTPAGVTFTASTRVLSGTPTGRFTSATFTHTATDADGTTLDLTFTIVVTADAIVFSPTSFANQVWVIGTAVALTLPAGSGGVGTLTASLTGTLPTGVTFNASTRALAGTPTADFSVATFTYTMTDAESVSASITFTILASDTPVALDVSLHNAILFKYPANYN